LSKIRAIALLSGGLDSQLAARVIQEQAIDVLAVTFVAPFHQDPLPGQKLSAETAAANLGVPLTILRPREAFLEILKHPKHGYGKNMNPCVDCHAFMFRQAGGLMREVGASFLATGEVLGQRPMSQMRHSLRVVEKESGIEGYLLRPLSAKLLPPTIPEQQGWVDREKLLDIEGRSRKRQMELARAYGLKDYPSPAGGCLATDPEFAHRVKDLFAHGDPTLNDLDLLKHGRHFRLDACTKAVVGRCREDNEFIQGLALPSDWLLELRDMPGPLTLLRGDPSAANVRVAAGLTARYSKAQTLPLAAVQVRSHGQPQHSSVVEAAAAAQDDVDRLILLKVRL
jgi:tRNA U34 2-thiouridine synthase MnmA/TrmU